MSRIIIALTGAKGAGKTTTFDIIKEYLPETQEVTLANRLKNASAKVFGIPRPDFDNPAVKEKELATPVYLTEENVTEIIKDFGYAPIFEKHIRPHIGKVLHTPRQVAQYIGTEVLRNVDEQIHCNGAVKDLPAEGVFVVTDMRFWNEFHFFQTLGNVKGNHFAPVFIHNSVAETKAAGDAHPSEKYVLEIAKECAKVDNNGSMLALRNQVFNIVNEALSAALVAKGDE